jgi:acetamidase/formamidase
MTGVRPTSSISLLALLVVAASGIGASRATAQQPTTHELPLVPANVHWGYFDASVPPVLRIRSGDRVRVEAMVARGLVRPRLAGMTDADFHPAELAVEAAVRERGPGAHPMTGPIWVEGAEAGDALEVVLESIDLLTDWGVSGHLPGGGTLPDDFPYGEIRIFRLDAATRTARMGDLDLTIPLAPFFGNIAVAPPVLTGRISSGPPGPHTGNIDNKDLVAGTRLFLPVLVEGALLSIGDGHAAQGDGEVSGTAIETSMAGTVQVVLHKGAGRRWPWAETPTHYMSMGLHPDLDEAARMATREMIDFLVREKGMTASDAYILCSVALDLRVTQLVDGTKGIHGMLPKSLFP